MPESEWPPTPIPTPEEAMVAHVTCPSRTELSDFLLGRLEPQRLDSLGYHIGGCTACEVALAGLESDDHLLGVVRKVARSRQPLEPRDPPLVGLVERVLRACRSAMLESNSARPSDESRVQVALRALTPLLEPSDRPTAYGRLGDYELLHVIGQGGMGIVFAAEDRKLQRRVAVKVLNPSAASQSAARERFLREAQSAARLSGHDHVVEIHQVGEYRNIPFLVMPLLRGQSLDTRMRSGAAPLSLAEVLCIGREVALGLAAAHAVGLVHRDLKPTNIWLDESGRTKLLDFGLAQTEVSGDLTESGVMIGTPDYMSPEQFDRTTVDVRSDLFSLGCILFELLTGERPFAGITLSQKMLARLQETPPAVERLNPLVPSRVSTLIARLLARRPDDRPDSAAEVVALLQGGESVSNISSALDSSLDAVSPQPGPAVVPKAAPEAEGPRYRRWHWAALTAVTSLVVVLWSLFGAAGINRQIPSAQSPGDPVDGRYPRLSAAALVTDPVVLSQSAKEVDSWTWETRAHRAGVSTMTFSADGRRLATCDGEGTLRIWESATGELQLVLPGPGRALGGIDSYDMLAWSPDGSVVAATFADGIVRLWDAESGRPLQVPPVASDDAGVLAWSPDSRQLATARYRHIQIWDVVTGRQVASLTPEAAGLHYTALGWSGDGQTIAAFVEHAANANQKELHLWDVASRQTSHQIKSRHHLGWHMRWSADSRHVALGNRSGHLEVFDAVRGAVVLDHSGSGDVTFLNRQLALGSDIVSWESGQPETTPIRTVARHANAWSPDGRYYCSLSGPGVVRLMRADQDTVIGTLESTNSGGRNRISWSRDGARVFSLGTVWDLAQGCVVRGFDEHGLGDPELSPSGKRLIFGRDARRVIANFETGVEQIVGWDVSAPVTWSGDEAFVVGFHDGKLVRYELATEESRELADSRFASAPVALAWSPVDATVAVISSDHQLLLWHGGTTERLAGPPIQATAHAARWSHDGKWLVVLGDDEGQSRRRQVYVLDAQGNLTRTLSVPLYPHGFRSFGFSADGSRVLVGGSDRRWHIFERASGELVETTAPTAPFDGDLSPDGRTVLIGGSWLWDVSKQRRMGRLVPWPAGLGTVMSAAGDYDDSVPADQHQVAVVRLKDRQLVLSPEEFARRFAWRNDSKRAALRLGQ